jgi:hypothetical protein
MTATKTRTGQENIHLSALSQAGRSSSSTTSPTALTAAPGVPPPCRASIAESYDGEIREATRSRLVTVEPANSRPLRVKTGWILKNGIPRRTLHVTVLFGIVGIVYYGVSLIPPFEGLRYQGESNANNRQTMAYAFLQECATRKVRKLPRPRSLESPKRDVNEWLQLQNLPLGRDCIKYLAMTPKAPPDIDIWMVDPPVSNTKKMRLLIRNFIHVAKEMITRPSEAPDLTEPCYDGPGTGLLAGHEFAFGIVSLALIYIFHPQIRYLLGEIFWLSILPSTLEFVRRPTPTISKYQWAVWILMLVSTVYTLVLLYQTLFYMPTGWAATSEFLATCKALEVRSHLSVLLQMLSRDRIRAFHLGRIVQSTLA